jgi:DNA topoisomerase 2-associated protein PAT1
MSSAHAHISKASVQQSKEGGAAEAAKLGRAALGDVADVRNLYDVLFFLRLTSATE